MLIELRLWLGIVLAFVAVVVSPFITAAFGWKIRKDLAEFKLDLLRELNGRYIWRTEGEDIKRRIDRLERAGRQ